MHLSVASVYGITFEPTFKCLLEEVTLCGKFKMYYNNNNDKFVECFFSMIQKLCYIKIDNLKRLIKNYRIKSYNNRLLKKPMYNAH